MIKSFQNIEPLASTSASLVAWDGPNIECIGLCKGMRVNTVIYRLGELLCSLMKELDLKEMDLKCLLNKCATCPNPAITLKTVLELLINKVCSLQEAISKLGTGGPAGQEAVLSVASCFYFTDAQGDIVKELTHSIYTRRIGLKVCELITDLNALMDDIVNVENQLSQLTIRVSTLETNSGAVGNLQTLLDSLRLEFDNLIKILGTNSELAQGIQAEPTGTGPQGAVMSLSDPTQALWVGTSKTVADSLKKVWLAIIDVRTAVKVIQDNCCKISCDDILIDFDAKVSEDGKTLTLFFAHKSHLPNGFLDAYLLGNTLTITDSEGHTHQVKIKLTDAVVDLDGVTIDLTLSPIVVKGDLTLTMDAAVKSENLQCVKCIVKTVKGQDTSCAFCQIKVTSATGSVAIRYEIDGKTGYATVKAGDVTVLPAGAIVKDVITQGSPVYESTCPLPNPTAVECFGTYFGVTSNLDIDQTWQQLKLQGMVINGVKYPFTAEFTVREAGDVQVNGQSILSGYTSTMWLDPMNNAAVIKDTVFSPCMFCMEGNHERGTLFSMVWKSAPGSMVNASIYGVGDRGSAAGQGPWIPIMFPVVPEADMGDIERCPCTLN